MHKFTFNYIGEDGASDQNANKWTACGTGKRLDGAVDNLFDNIKQITGIDMEDWDKLEVFDYILQAIEFGIAHQRDFSTPEDNFDIIYNCEL